MPDVLRIKRRPVGGAAGAPTSLAAAEVAFNEQTSVLYYGSGNSGGAATAIFPIGGPGAFLPLAGGTMAGGVSFGAALAPGGVTDLSRHITLHTAGYGLGITSGRINYVSGGSHFFVIGSTDVMQVSATGINSAAIGAVAPSTGSFTTLAASGVVSGAGFTTLLGTIASSTLPVMNGTAAIGVGTTWARADHVHASDTSRAPLAGPTFTGTVTIPTLAVTTAATMPTAAVGTTDTNIATTQFVARMQGYLNNGALPDADTAVTAAQAGQRVLRFTGALTADRTYTLPSMNQRNWLLWNNTTGGFNILFTIGGTTISMPSGYRGEIFNDGAGVFGAHNCLPAQAVRIGPGDRNGILFTSGATLATAATIEGTGTGAISFLTTVALSGTPTAPTAAATTNTTQIATTAFVKSISVVVATIAALRALNTTATYVYVQGYYAIGDGGGGDYVKAGAGTDNGGSIIVSANGTFYLQTYGNPINVMQFGAVGDGVTNDSTAIQNAINAVQTAGGGIVKFPAKVFAHTTQLIVGQSGVRLEGSGMDASHDFTPVWTNYSNMRPVTALLWTGANNGNQVLVAPQANNDAGGALGGCAVVNMNFIAGAFPFTVAAASAVVVQAVKDSEFSFFALEHKFYGLLFSCLNRSATWNNAVSFCRIPYLGYRGTASTAGGALRMDGIDLVGNCYNNLFGMINVLHNNGHAIDLYSCDNNVFETVRIQRVGGGVGVGVYFRPGATADTPARANLFNLLSPGAGGVFSDSVGTVAPYENKIQYYNPDENSAPAVPSIGNGSTLFYSTTKQSGNTNFSATTNADQVIASSASATKVAFNTVLVDPAFWFDTTNRRWWTRYPGVYIVTGAVLFDIVAAVGSRHIYIYKNATTIVAQTQAINRFTSGAESISVTGSVYLNGTTDYIEIYVQQDSGVNATVRNTSNTTNLFMGSRAA